MMMMAAELLLLFVVLLTQGRLGVSECVHDASDQHRPLPSCHLSATAAPHHVKGGGRHRSHVGTGGRRFTAGRRHLACRRAERRWTGLLRRSMARRTRPALRLFDGRHGAAVFPAAGHPVVHIRQHWRHHLGQAGTWRSGDNEGSKICGIKAQGALPQLYIFCHPHNSITEPYHLLRSVSKVSK